MLFKPSRCELSSKETTILRGSTFYFTWPRSERIWPGTLGSRTWKITNATRAKSSMMLTRVERERITDSRLKIQSAAKSLKHIDPGKVQNFEGIRECLEAADQNLGGALREPDADRHD
jgi:hypothetical protein